MRPGLVAERARTPAGISGGGRGPGLYERWISPVACHVEPRVEGSKGEPPP
jgi:hypothetical protein